MVRHLVMVAGCSVDAISTYGGGRYGALHWAVYRRQAATAKLLLELGADTDMKGNYLKLSGTPLDWARLKGDSEITALLQENRKGGSSNRIYFVIQCQWMDVHADVMHSDKAADSVVM
jgi:ankyrin repeat protein